jgi:hypothetical protein
MSIFVTNKRAQIFFITSCILSLISFILYIFSTYFPNLDSYSDILDCFVMIIYSMEYIIKLILSHDRINYMLKIKSLFDLLLSLVPFLGFVRN